MLNTTAGENLVSVRGVDVEIAGRKILDGVSLDICTGEIVTVIGPNGAGKTTMVKVVLGLLAPTRGQVMRKSKIRIGYVPQQFSINPIIPLNVYRLMTLTVKANRSRVEEALATTGVAHLIDQPMVSLSGGERQRVLLARALLRQPDLLILDEPVQGVDFSGQVAMYQLISDIRAQARCAILMISHDLHIVMAQSDRVICLNTHVCCQGHPEEVGKNPEYAHMFGDAASPTLGLYAHSHDHNHDHTHNHD
jgi:zinc transport system ATP-binding protein